MHAYLHLLVTFLSSLKKANVCNRIAAAATKPQKLEIILQANLAKKVRTQMQMTKHWTLCRNKKNNNNNTNKFNAAEVAVCRFAYIPLPRMQRNGLVAPDVAPRQQQQLRTCHMCRWLPSFAKTFPKEWKKRDSSGKWQAVGGSSLRFFHAETISNRRCKASVSSLPFLADFFFVANSKLSARTTNTLTAAYAFHLLQCCTFAIDFFCCRTPSSYFPASTFSGRSGTSKAVTRCHTTQDGQILNSSAWK